MEIFFSKLLEFQLIGESEREKTFFESLNYHVNTQSVFCGIFILK